MSTGEFWSLIPMEFYYIYDKWYDARTVDYQTSWEQTRMAIFYQYMSIPIKGRHANYQKFKLEHIPFPWDKVSKVEVDEEDYEMKQIELENKGLDPKGWAERIKNMQQVGTKVKENELKELK